MAATEVTYIWAAIAGVLSFLSPCVLPLVPSYLCYMAGTSLDQFTEGQEIEKRALQRKVFVSALAFVFGFSLVFVALGAGASAMGRYLLANQDILAKISGIIIIIFGLHFMGLFRFAFLNREARFTPEIREGLGVFGPILIGIAFAFGWTPCIGPMLGTILMIAGSSDSMGYGVSLLWVYSLGLGIPFLLAALGMGRFLGFLKGARRHMRTIEIMSGGLLVVTGIMMYTGTFTILANYLLGIMPGLVAYT